MLLVYLLYWSEVYYPIRLLLREILTNHNAVHCGLIQLSNQIASQGDLTNQNAVQGD